VKHTHTHTHEPSSVSRPACRKYQELWARTIISYALVTARYHVTCLGCSILPSTSLPLPPSLGTMRTRRCGQTRRQLVHTHTQSRTRRETSFNEQQLPTNRLTDWLTERVSVTPAHLPTSSSLPQQRTTLYTTSCHVTPSLHMTATIFCRIFSLEMTLKMLGFLHASAVPYSWH